MQPKNAITIALAGFVILALWFVFGFLFPLFFEDIPANNGVFGDGFGSVNALFSGLGFLALTYTIILQIESFKDQKQQERFSLVLKLIDEIKEDLRTFQFNGQKGVDGVIELQKKYVRGSIDLIGLDGVAVVYLTCVVTQLKSTITYMTKFFKNGEDEKTILRDKIGVLFLVYLVSLSDTLGGIKYENENLSSLLKGELEEIHKILYPKKPV